VPAWRLFGELSLDVCQHNNLDLSVTAPVALLTTVCSVVLTLPKNAQNLEDGSFQPSAVGAQLLDKRGEHAFHLDSG
jgi:hypothetical protein